MGSRFRLTLLLLTTILSVNLPPAGPPGNTPINANLVPVVACPDPECGGKGRRQSDRYYLCGTCGEFFYYCTACFSHFTEDQVTSHNHTPS
jgi:hypothetical protein